MRRSIQPNGTFVRIQIVYVAVRLKDIVLRHDVRNKRTTRRSLTPTQTMDLLWHEPGSSSDEEETDNPPALVPVVSRPDRRFLVAAPPVSLKTMVTSTALTTAAAPQIRGGRQAGALMVMNNPTKTVLYQPIQGVQAMDPQISLVKEAEKQANVAFDGPTFSLQRTSFQRTGMALAPTDDGQVVMRTTLGYDRKRLELLAQQEVSRKKRPRVDGKVTRKDKEEELVLGSDDEAEFGVWAPPSAEERWVAENQLSDITKGGLESLAPEQLAERAYIKERDRQKGLAEESKEELSAFERLLERKMAHLLPPKMESDQPLEPSTTFHGTAELDYKGRSWAAPPAGLGAVAGNGELDMDHHKCFVPKKCVHRFTGHNMGVHRIRLFPHTGHLLLSAGLDGKCKVWSVEQKQVMRTYVGHSAGVRDVQFNHDGSKFVSASFDRYLRLWNTESGQVLQTFTNKKVPYVVKFYPRDDNFFVVGCSDNKIVTYDATTAEITQEYNHHLAPVNAILFVEDNGTKMVTSSDDKKILVWEWDIGVPIKIISDPTMHSMPCLVMHPSHRFFCAQSLDNTIAVFQSGNRFSLQKKKKFSGHIVSGYACEMAFSPDGQYLVSGDGTGSLFFWDWKKHKIMQKYRAHSNGPAICCAWHPLDSSTVFTCGWDGVIKMWN
jgi:pre-mRNA-processing factor 17